VIIWVTIGSLVSRRDESTASTAPIGSPGRWRSRESGRDRLGGLRQKLPWRQFRHAVTEWLGPIRLSAPMNAPIARCIYLLWLFGWQSLPNPKSRDGMATKHGVRSLKLWFPNAT